ncbi:hypothetical protein [Raineyella antarctica]|nr:hypothetical protein [Raineyella antarctica]
MLSVDDQADQLVREVLPVIPVADQSFVKGCLEEGDPDMAIDDCMQFSLINGIRLSDGVLDSVEETVLHAGYDRTLQDRTLGWIAKHRERNHAAA